MKTNLVSILWKKEIIHWRRMEQMLKRFNSIASKLTFGLLGVFLVTIGHYAFAIMHTLYELFLYVFARKAFKANLQKLALKV